MAGPGPDRYSRLASITGRVARAVAELQAARSSASELPPEQASELEELVERLQALQVLLANEVERAWNAAEAAARRARRAEILGRLHDATSAETRVPLGDEIHLWPPLSQEGSAPPSGEGRD